MEDEASLKKALREAIENLYLIFADYKLPEEWPRPYNIDEATFQTLHSKPLLDLTAKDFTAYSFYAINLWGTQADFKHFLPRLLELSATSPVLEGVDIYFIFNKFSIAEWESWSEIERIAVENYFVCLWKVILITFPFHILASHYVTSLASVVKNLEPFLDIWQNSCKFSVAAIRHLSYFLEGEVNNLVKGRLSNSTESQAAQVISWLLNPRLTELIERVFFDCSSNSLVESETLADASKALDKIEWVRIAQGV